MKRKVGVVVFTHGSRLPEGNATMLQFVEKLRERFGTGLIEPCFLELGKPSIPVALKKLVRQGCTHIFGYALFLAPGKHLQTDIPFIFEQTLKKHPAVTWEISPAMMTDPALIELVACQIAEVLKTGTSQRAT
jgi:sirohydrochlorin cobaltochelatase